MPTEAELDASLGFIEQSFMATLEAGDDKSGLDYEKMDTAVYRLVICAKGSLLYELVSEVMERRVRNVTDELASVPTDLEMSTLATAWKKYNDGVVLVDEVLLYMKRAYLPGTSLESIQTLGHRIFREALAEHLSKSRFVDNWRHQITIDMINGVPISEEQKQVAHTMQELFKKAPELYASFFEMPLQQAAVKVYHDKAVKHLNENGTEGFSEAVEEWVRLEAARAAVFVRQFRQEHMEGHMTAITDLMLLADSMYQRPDA